MSNRHRIVAGELGVNFVVAPRATLDIGRLIVKVPPQNKKRGQATFFYEAYGGTWAQSTAFPKSRASMAALIGRSR
jgi:hypothetical protein